MKYLIVVSIGADKGRIISAHKSYWQAEKKCPHWCRVIEARHYDQDRRIARMASEGRDY